MTEPLRKKLKREFRQCKPALDKIDLYISRTGAQFEGKNEEISKGLKTAYLLSQQLRELLRELDAKI